MRTNWFALLAIAVLASLPEAAAGPRWSLEQELAANNGVHGDGFGDAVAVNGDTAVVGAPYKNVGANFTQGSAYVFVRSGAGWAQQLELPRSDGALGDNFGIAVAVDGDTIVVGAASRQVGANGQQGAVYVFVRSGSGWVQQQMLINPSGGIGYFFGVSVAISGETLVVGEEQTGGSGGNGAAYVYVRSGGVWSLQQTLTASNGALQDTYGYSVSISGNTVLVGAPSHSAQQGAAYVYVRSGSTWSEQQILNGLSPGDNLGISVSVDGDTAVAGAFLRNSHQGSAFVFVRSGVTWSQQQELTAFDGLANELYGDSVSVSGDTVVVGDFFKKVGSSHPGAAYVYTRSHNVWSLDQELTAPDGANGDEYGISVSVNGNTAIIGAYAHSSFLGSAYVYVKPYADAYQIGYAANLAVGDSVVNLTSAGTRNGFDPAGNICANIYGFDVDQQLIACCSCPLTPNHLKTFSVKQDLANNALTPGVPQAVTIAILASDLVNGTCDATSPTFGNLEQGMRAWGTTIHASPAGSYQVTERPFSNAPLSLSELAKLTTYCGFIKANGSGYGICNSCRQGALGATRQ